MFLAFHGQVSKFHNSIIFAGNSLKNKGLPAAKLFYCNQKSKYQFDIVVPVIET